MDNHVERWKVDEVSELESLTDNEIELINEIRAQEQEWSELDLIAYVVRNNDGFAQILVAPRRVDVKPGSEIVVSTSWSHVRQNVELERGGMRTSRQIQAVENVELH
jgi:hypothetical protein